jgi:Fe-S-cluster formation regulator IscX/YfhJ
VQKITGDESMHSARFNDDPNTTVEDVLEAFDVAIELAEKDEGLEPA